MSKHTYPRGIGRSAAFDFIMQTAPPTDGSCWLWRGATDKKGYGRIGGGRAKYLAHRVSYEKFIGPIPDGLHILHSCDTPACVQPAHLRAGTNAENVRDAVERGRQRNGSTRGTNAGETNGTAKLTDDDARYIRTSTATQREIAEQFGVSQATVSMIRSGKTWRHLD